MMQVLGELLKDRAKDECERITFGSSIEVFEDIAPTESAMGGVEEELASTPATVTTSLRCEETCTDTGENIGETKDMCVQTRLVVSCLFYFEIVLYFR